MHVRLESLTYDNGRNISADSTLSQAERSGRVSLNSTNYFFVEGDVMFRIRTIGLALAVAAIVLAATTSDAFAGKRGKRGGGGGTTVVYSTQYVPVVRVYPTYPQPVAYPYPYPYPYPYSTPVGTTMFYPVLY